MPEETDEIAAALPEYRVGEELGRGAFGVVWSGCHKHLDRAVAIKQLSVGLAGDPKVRYRFAEEARTLARMSHPHIVPIYDYVERDGLCLLVMEHLPGGTVWSQFQGRGYNLETSCAVVMAVCAGLHYAHQRDVLHRDVKPENLLFSADGVLKVTDFGIAKVVGGAETLATRGGEILGTPAYIAPEQAEGRELGPGADVYATGVMLYELLSGQLPYSQDGGPLSIIYRHVYEDPLPLLGIAPEIGPDLAEVTMNALARRPEDRYQSAEEFGVAIANAVTAGYGPEWLSRSELVVVDPGPIATAARLPSTAVRIAPPPPGAPTVRGRAGRSRSRPNADGTVRRETPSGGTPSGGTPSGGTPSGVTPSRVTPSRVTRVKPSASERVAGPRAVDIAQAELVPVRDVIEVPPRPLAQAAAALILFLLVLAVAIVGVGERDRTRVLPVGAASVAGVDVAAGRPARLDLSKPVEVRLAGLPAAAAGASRVELGFSVIGVPGGATTTEALSQSGSEWVASLEAGSLQFLMAGQATAELRLLDDKGAVLRHQFPAEFSRSAFLTIPGGLVVALAVFVLAYLESLFKPLRRAQQSAVRLFGCVVLGGLLGLAVVLVVWLFGGPEPTATTGFVCALLAAGAAAAAAAAAVRAGRRGRTRTS